MGEVPHRIPYVPHISFWVHCRPRTPRLWVRTLALAAGIFVFACVLRDCRVENTRVGQEVVVENTRVAREMVEV